MRTVGLLGGMSWQSTQSYYQLINEGVQARLGGLHSAPLLIYSFDFAEIEALQMAGQWAAAGEMLARQAARLEVAEQRPSFWPPTPCISWRIILQKRCLCLCCISLRPRLRPFWPAVPASPCCWPQALPWNRIYTGPLGAKLAEAGGAVHIPEGLRGARLCMM